MRHTSILCSIIFCFFALSLHAQKSKNNANDKGLLQSKKKEVYEQIIRVKFKPEETARLDAMLAQKGNAKGVLKSQGFGPLQTGFTAIDNKNNRYKANSMRRVFRPAGKFEERHRAWGLHLWYEIRFSANAPVAELMSAYANVESVEIAEPVYVYSLRDVEGHEPLPYVGHVTSEENTSDPAPASTPNDSRYNEQWGYGRINAPQAWDIETGDPRVVVAIEDQGVDYNHPDLDGRMWTNPGETPGNNIDDDNNGYVDDYYGYNFGDDRGEIAIGSHGTHVGGTVAAETNNGTGVSGTAGGWGDNQGVRLMSLSVFGANSQGGFDEAFIYAADNGAVISQNSWGGGSQSAAMENAIDYFIANAGGSGQAMQGGLAVFAAGNDNSSSTSIGYPASYAPTVAVASITSGNKKSSFSNYGSWVDISAPGSSILSTYPNGSYNSISGTSMACPHVSGVAALVVSYNYGNITASQLRNILESTTSDVYVDNPNYQGQLGSGVVDAYAALTGGSGGGENPPPPAYCASKGNSVADEWINSVNIGSFSYTSGSNGGYADFSGTQTVEAGTGSSSVSLSPGFSGSSYNEYWRIWIDYNKDNDFSDAGELVFDAGSLSSSTVNGTISIPSSAEGITTRMRVTMKYNGAPSPCETFNYGEVEDYTVIIGSGSTPTCDAPGSLSASSVSSGSATLNWGAVSGANSYNVRYRKTGTSSWSTTSATGTSVSVSGLSASTQYEFQVASVCSGGTSAFSASATFTTSAASVNYCASRGNNASYEWIDYVSLNGMTRTSSGDGGYYNGTSSTATVVRGSSNTIYVSAGFSGSSYTEYWKVWIDLNQDGDFTDSGELLVSGSSSSSATLSASLAIPSGAVLGKTRMRVSMKYNAAQSSCETFSYGEVEDYSVNITSTAMAALRTGSPVSAEMLGNEPPKVMFSAYPNPANEKLTISTIEKAGFSATIYNLNGSILRRGESDRSELKLDVSDLENGLYFIKVKGERETTTLKFMKE